MTQTQLGDVLGLTFQQIQKYERGTNRISASKLALLANALKVPVSVFFEGCENGEVTRDGEDEVRQLVACFEEMPEPLQADFLRMVKSIAAASY
jgi:transcriptional regulator with XRE-family HTH domain